MRPYKSTLVVVLTCVVGLAAAQLLEAQQRQLHIGKWTLNLGKSKLSGQAPKEQTRTYVQQGEATKVTIVGIDADGNRVAYGYTLTPDGKSHPVVAAMPNNADTIEVKQASPNVTETVFKKGGMVVETMRTETSSDGKQLTITSTKTDTAGHQVKDVMVFDKTK